MDTDTVVWIVVAVLVVLLLAGVALWASKRGTHYRDERNRSKAAALRQEAQSREADVRRQEAQAQELRAEADKKAAEADRLAAMATDREHTAEAHRSRYDETIQKVDELDPDVDRARRRP